MSTPIRIKRSAVPGKVPTLGDLQLGELAINTYDGKAYLKKDVGGTESIVNVGGGYPGKTYYVSETGLDTNDGENISSAFLTIKAALAVATAGDTIEISSGTFPEIFPLTVPTGVIVRGKGLRSTIIQPTSGTERNDAFLLNGETTIEELTVTNFYYNSSADTGYAFRFAPGMVTTTRSPYIQRVTVLTKGSDTSASDPYGFETADNYPTSKIAGRGALVDGSVVSSATLEPAMLFNEATFITPNQTGLKMTNGARAEWVNCFTYFSSVSIDGVSGSVGVGSTAGATLKLSGISTTITANQVIKYYQGGPAVAIGTVTSVDGAYVTISGKGSGVFNSVGIGSTQDVRIFASDGVTQVGTASTILWADYQKFGADLRAIGSASNFGTVGVRGDGAGVQLRLFGYNFGCVGSGKTFTQDPTLTVRSNEAIQLNGGRVFFQSVDQEGNFRVGSIFEISQETGAVSLASTSDINIAGTATIQNLNVTGVSTFQGQILHQDSNFITDETTYNLINTNANAVNFAGAATSIVMGAATGIATIRNYEVNLSGGQDSYSTSTGTLTVDGGVGIGSNLNVGKDLKVTGVSTFVSPVRLDSSLRVAGVSTFVDDMMLSSDLNVAGITTTSTFRVTGISTLSGDVRLDNNLRVAGVSTFVQSIDANSTLNVTGVSTLTGNARLGGQLRVAGISTLIGDVEISNNLRVAGVSTFNNPAMINSNLNVTGITTTATFRVTGISTLTGDVELSNALRVAGVSTFSNPAMINSNLNVTGITTTGNFRVTGVSTLTGDTNLTNNLNVGGITTTATFRVTGISTLTGNVELSNALRVSGVSTFVGDSMFSGNARVAGVSTFVSSAMINSNLNVTGITTTGNFRVTGVSTLTGDTNLTNNLNVGGITTTSTFRVTGISTLTGNVEMSNALRVSGVSTFVGDSMFSGNARIAGVSTIVGSAMIDSNLRVTGITTTGNLRVTGISTLTGDTQFSNNIQVAGVGTISNFTISSGIITGPSTIIIDPAGVGDNTGSVRIKGDLYVDGTQTTVNSTVVEIGDKLVGLGTTAIEVVVTKTNANISAGTSTITGISTNLLAVGYAVSSQSTTGAGTSIVSIGSSTVLLSGNVNSNTNIILSSVQLGINTTQISGISTSGILVGAALSVAELAANTVVTSIETSLINFSPASTNVGIATTTVLVTNTGTFIFYDTLTGDVLSDGGGILLYGRTNKTFTWSDTSDSWTSSENLNLASGRILKIDNQQILSAFDLTVPSIYVNSGLVTGISGTTLTYTNGTITNIENVNLNNTGVATFPNLNVSTVDITGISTISIVGINTLRANTGIITDLVGTDFNYSGVGTVQTLNVPTGATFKVINDATISGITTVNDFISTSFYVTGVGTFANVVNINSGISTRFDTTELNVISGTLQIVGITTTTGTFVGLNTDVIGINTTGLLVGDNVSGTYLFPSSVITSIGNTSITVNFATTSPVGTSTTDVTITRQFTPAGVGTIPNFRSTNTVISGIASINTGIVTDLIVGVSSISTLNLNVGFATVFSASTGIITSLYTTGVGTISTLYVNSGITTRSTITDLDVIGVGSFATIANINTPTGLSTIGHLTGENINYSGIATINNLVAGLATITTLDVTGISSLPNLYGSDIQYTGISTLTELTGTNFYYSGLSTAVNFNSTDTIVSGVASISTLRADVGIITNSVWTDGYSSGITSLGTLRFNSGFATSLVAESFEIGYLIGTNFYISGIGSANRFDINVGTSTHFTTNDFEATGFSTVVSFKATDAEVTGVTTIGTKLIVPDTEISHIANGVNLAFSGIGTIDTLRTNIGFVTSLSGTNLYYPGIGTIGWVDAENIDVAGIATITRVYSTDINVSGVTTSARFIGTDTEFEHSELVDINVSSAATIARLTVTDGTITNLTGTIGTITRIQNVDLNTTGVATITQLEGTNSNITGISTFGEVIATTIRTDALDLSGTAINFTGIATFRVLQADDATLGTTRSGSLDVSGISTLPTIYNVDIQSTGFTTTYNGLHVGAGGTIITANATTGIGSVGINTSIPRNALHVYGNIQQDGSTLVGTISTERNNNAAVKVHTELSRFDYRSVEYTVQVSYGVTHQVAKIMSIHDGVTAYNSEYANISTGIDIATFDVQVDNTVPPGNIALIVTPTYASGITTIVANFHATRLTSL